LREGKKRIWPQLFCPCNFKPEIESGKGRCLRRLSMEGKGRRFKRKFFRATVERVERMLVGNLRWLGKRKELA